MPTTLGRGGCRVCPCCRASRWAYTQLEGGNRTLLLRLGGATRHHWGTGPRYQRAARTAFRKRRWSAPSGRTTCNSRSHETVPLSPRSSGAAGTSCTRSCRSPSPVHTHPRRRVPPVGMTLTTAPVTAHPGEAQLRVLTLSLVALPTPRRFRSGCSVREHGLVRSGFLRKGFLGQVIQDSLVEGG